MARYYDMNHLKEMIEAKADTVINGAEAFHYIAKWLDLLPPADVVPRAEVEQLEYTLAGVMWSVDKWLEGDELEQDEVNRAITMREKTLRIVEELRAEVEELKESYLRFEETSGLRKAKTEVAREIFAEIGKILYKHTNLAIKANSVSCELMIDYIGEDIAELKKKYTKGGDIE